MNPQGKVLSKYFEDDYTERYTSADILVREFGAAATGVAHQVERTRHLALSSSSTAGIVRPGQRIALTLDVDLAPGIHVYAPGATGYKEIAWTFGERAPVKAHEPLYPKSKVLYLKAIQERAPVYKGKFRITREVTLASQRTLKPLLSPSGELTVEGSFLYQACDAKVCYIPQTVPVRWKFIVESHDSERAPSQIRRPGLQ